MASMMINPDGDAHGECFRPDYPRVHDGASYIEVTPGDRDDVSDPCEIEAREFDGFGGVSVARIRPDAAGLDERGFIFLDDSKRPFLCRTVEDRLLLFSWKIDHFVAFRPTTREIALKYPRNLTEQEQDAYRNRHDEYVKK